jgi:hypothetical protein
MELPLPEIIDRLTILKLKIERVGEPHLNQEYEKWNEALERFEQREIRIRQEWFDKLYEINREIWDLDWDLRKIVASGVAAEEAWGIAKEEIGSEEVGRRAKLIMQLVRVRAILKNKIVEETGVGFREIKRDH